MSSPHPDNLTTTVFRALYPEFDLVTVGGTYIVYGPANPDTPLMYIADGLGAIACQISELENTDVELADLVADDAAEPLPHRYPR
jgi:hypothetical protein